MPQSNIYFISNFVPYLKELQLNGFDCVFLSGRTMRTKTQALVSIQQKLGLIKSASNNYDALADSLRDLQLNSDQKLAVILQDPHLIAPEVLTMLLDIMDETDIFYNESEKLFSFAIIKEN